jgi:hypothetical protein
MGAVSLHERLSRSSATALPIASGSSVHPLGISKTRQPSFFLELGDEPLGLGLAGHRNQLYRPVRTRFVSENLSRLHLGMPTPRPVVHSQCRHVGKLPPEAASFESFRCDVMGGGLDEHGKITMRGRRAKRVGYSGGGGKLGGATSSPVVQGLRARFRRVRGARSFGGPKATALAGARGRRLAWRSPNEGETAKGTLAREVVVTLARRWGRTGGQAGPIWLWRPSARSCATQLLFSSLAWIWG